MKPTLLLLAAGMGSRYGGLKQLDGLGPNGATIMDYSIYDAIQAGFGKIVFVIRKDFEDQFREKILSKYEGHIPAELCFQALDDLPEGFSVPEGREKPWGTNHAVLMAKDIIKEPFCVINCDDFYNRDCFMVIGKFLSELPEGSKNRYAMVGFRVGNTLSENGTVARGICSKDADENLTTCVERTEIMRIDGKVSYKDEQCEWVAVGDNTPVSMNVWGFTPDYFQHSEEYFKEFLSDPKNMENKKAEFFKGLKDTYSTNLEKKQQLVNKAKELADSTDWKKTGDKLIALQKEWKKVGTVPHKQGELLWKEFLDTCNKFFEARNKQNAGSRSEEHANLDKKRNIIAQLKELIVAEITDNDLQKKLKDLAKQYSAIGHVPFKEKDKVYKEYHEAIDAAYEKLHATNAKRHFDNFKNNLKNVAKEGVNALGNERSKLLRRYDQLRNEITTYENNLGFFNTASKKGNSLVEEMNRKIEKLKADLEMVKQKIKAIDAEKK